MAKDPAVLFYYQDFLVGTEFMSDDEVGKYIKILCHLADKGRLTKNHILNICKTSVIAENILEKLKVDSGGFYYNQRMLEEKEKRLKYSESRRNNRIGHKDMMNISNTYDKHMENENENINVINKGESVERGDHLTSNSKPTLIQVQEYFEGLGYPKAEAENFWSYYDSLGWETSRGGLIKNWQSKVMGWMNNSKHFNNNGNGKEAKPINTAFSEKKNKELKKTLASFDEQIKREGKFKKFKDYEGVANVSD